MTSITDQLSRQRGLTHLGEADRDALASCLRRRTLSRGEILFREGDVGDSMFFVEEGALQVLLREPARTQRRMQDVTSGELLGEMACIDPSARSATALAAQDTRLLMLTRDGLHALRGHCPAPAQAVFGAAARALARRLGDAHARLIERVGRPTRSSSGVFARHASAPEAPRPLSERVAGWFARGAS